MVDFARGVCFNHDVLHEGSPVKSGVKWVLRSDVMFRRVDRFPSFRFSYLTDERFVTADRDYQLSIALQKQGRPEESTAAFLRATELHAQLASDRSQKRALVTVELTSVLPRDVWIEICLRLDLPNVLAVSNLNSFFLKLIRTSSRLWFEMFVRRWPGGANPRTIAQFRWKQICAKGVACFFDFAFSK